MKTLSLIVLTGALLLPPAATPARAQAPKPGFDCAAAKGYAEVTICSSPDLAAEDGMMAGSFRRLIETSGPAAAAGARAEQKAWLARRDACTSAGCLMALYKARNQALTDRIMSPEPSSAALLTGTFLGTISPGEFYNALTFDEDMLAMDRDAIVRIAGPRNAATDRALDAMTFISIDNRSPLGRRINAACRDKCRIAGTIEQVERDSWYFKTVTAVEALPDGHDFAGSSARIGGAAGTAPVISGGEPPRDVGAGDALRKPLLDALRPAIEADLGQPVQFVVKTLRKQNDWAFAVVTPRTKAGGAIDFSKTRHAGAIRAGMFDGGTVFALLRRQGAAWSVRTFAVGPTDVVYAGWPDEFGAPYPLFGLEAP